MSLSFRLAFDAYVARKSSRVLVNFASYQKSMAMNEEKTWLETSIFFFFSCDIHRKKSC